MTIVTAMNTVIYEGEAANAVSLHTVEGGVRKWRYRLKLQPVSEEEFRLHWQRSFSLNTIEHIMLSRLGDSGRLYFRKNTLEQVGNTGRRKQIVRPEDGETLSSIFGVPGDLIMDARKTLLSRTGRGA